MSSDRREFLRHAGALVAALGTGQRAPASSADEQPTTMPTALAIAVSNAGALGAIGTTNVAADRVKALVSETRAGTSRPFAVNFLLALEPTTLDVALEAGAPIVQFSWGLPIGDAVAAIRRAGAKMGIQIANAEGAKRALDLGADYVICQGLEAGGHVQAASPLDETLPRVLDVAGQTPVIAGGGVANGQAIHRALLAGASGVLIGTRFVATKESNAHPDYKSALTRARAADTAFTVCFQDGWAATHRALRNRTFTNWEAAGCPGPGKRPGEGDIVATSATGAAIRRYSYSSPRPGTTGDILEMALYAGRGVDAIRDLPAAGELVERLWKECLTTR